MTTTLQQQQEAIREAMTNQASKIWVQDGGSRPTPQRLQKDEVWAALNDAASTIAALRMTNSAHELLKEKHSTALGEIRDLKKRIAQLEKDLRECRGSSVSDGDL